MGKWPPRISAADLVETARTFPPEVREDQNRIIFTLGVSAIRHFFGQQWCEHHIIQDAAHSRPDGFMRLDFRSDFEREKKTARMLDFAETLFNLQNVEGFDERVEQMRTSEVEAAFAEFDFARFLYIHDIDFKFVVPSGVKGSDYDFRIIYDDDRTACADAKCRLEATEMRADTVRNSLHKARRNNLPTDQAGIIFVKAPQKWLEEQAVRIGLYDVVREFLCSTQRIVSVVIYATVAIELRDQQMILMRHRFNEFTNPTHRFDTTKNWVLFKDYEVPEEWGGMPPNWIRVFSKGFIMRER
jgi:hypothetical protein